MDRTCARTYSVSEWPSGMSRRIRGPTNMKATSGAACPTPYPISATIPAHVPVSAGLNSTHEPMTDATSVAVDTVAPALPRDTRYSSMPRAPRLT